MATIGVTVAWMTPAVQELVRVDVAVGATAREAIERSGLPAAYRLDLASLAVAIHGRRASLDTPLAAGDRVELLRPLAADPKDARRARARSRREPSRRNSG
jgi:putative ubiquitin-RnfH superfamily antitoxin RatB of RatAB toxin-antitoxin module